MGVHRELAREPAGGRSPAPATIDAGLLPFCTDAPMPARADGGTHPSAWPSTPEEIAIPVAGMIAHARGAKRAVPLLSRPATAEAA